MKYLKVFTDFADKMEMLGDAERGRLFTAMLKYAETGEAPDLKGDERFLWATAKLEIDRQAASYKNKVEGAEKARSLINSDIRVNQSDDVKIRLISVQEKDKDKEKDNSPNGEIKRARKSKKATEPPKPPTLDEVKAYCAERSSSVDPVQFWEYFNAGNWKDSEGKPVLAWKQKLLTWEKNERARPAQRRTHITTAEEYKNMPKNMDFSVLDDILDNI